MGHASRIPQSDQASASGCDPEIEKAVTTAAIGGKLTCRAAMAIAKQFAVPPHQVGQAMDTLGIRIQRCQLGLFGYPPPNTKPVGSLDKVSAELRQAFTAAARSGSPSPISCREIWKTADNLRVPRMQAASACEILGIKIKPCQLGAF